ncbi:hypothetical protein [Polaromonas sp. YR568]|uniref:hypothetical protein n=1 Tax=Polaromonas sp. YR568 TaxID=1855301 RepID=UPI00398C20B5
MAFFLTPYLTEYDETLSADTYIDPIGTLIIWSTFGRQVFKNRVNSISNDVRNYTLNLFHHFLVRKLVADDAVQLSSSLQQKYGNKDALAFKQACLILLENLFVYSVLRHENLKDVKTAGVLGISKARRRWDQDEGDPVIVFTHETAGQILVRQLGLGVSGRYKTPLVEIGFFDSGYQYFRPAFQSRWSDAAAFVTGNSNDVLAKIEREAYAFLKAQLPKLRHKGALRFRIDVPEKLTKAYALAFSSPAAVGAYARQFWLRQTELDSGAAGALMKVLEAESGEALSSRRVVEKALKEDLQPLEKAKLDHIIKVEPFLSDCALLFTLMTRERKQSVGAVAVLWESFGRDGNRLPGLAQELTAIINLPALRGSEAGRRFSRLQQVAKAGDFESQVRALVKYHSDVMQARGQPVWLSIDNGGSITVHSRTATLVEPGTRRPGAWYNDYYVPQFRSLVKGLQGVGT